MTNLPQEAATHSLNPRHSTYDSNDFLADYVDPSTVNNFTLTLKISRHNKQQEPAKPDFIHRYLIIYVSCQQQEVELNQN
jgi:hypothetical protein